MFYISWNFVLHPVERPLHSIKMTCYEGKQNRTIGKSLLQLIYIKFNLFFDYTDIFIEKIIASPRENNR